MTLLPGLVALCLVLAPALGYDSALYDDMLFQDLYKRLSNSIDDQYNYVDDYSQFNGAPLWGDSIALDSRDSGQADIRDPEVLAHSSNSDGFQYISGGAGEGKQHLTPEGTQENTQEVKTDEVLPFYCHPPNPCPKGFTEEDGCQANIEDTAEVQKQWISQLQEKGKCSCDEEHMFDCGTKMGGEDGYGFDKQGGADLSNLIDSILAGQDGLEYNKNPFEGGVKLAGRAAKKSPRAKRVSPGV